MWPFFRPYKSHSFYYLYLFVLLKIFCFLFWLPAGCSQSLETENNSVLESILEKGKMVVLTRNAPTTYYYGSEGESGYEYDLVTAYADYLGVNVRFEIRNTVEEVLEALANGEGDFAGAGLTRTDERAKYFLFGPPYFQVQQQLVCRRGGRMPRSIEEMGQVFIEVTAESSYMEKLGEIEKEVEDLNWRKTEYTTEQILERVWQGHVDCGVADSNIVSLNRRYLPELLVAFPVSEMEELAWALPPNAHKLQESMKKWFSEAEDSFSAILYGRYYSHVEIFDYVDTARFKRRIYTRLPAYEPLMKEAGQKYGIDWKFLAAMAYQESHWDPKARSPTGVRGIMMLTQRTASQLGVDNRLDPRQSIMGGARYFANLHGRLPDEVPEPDRTWIAMAAYNVGMGHIFDARKLGRQLGKDPNLWVEFREVLPLLAQPQYYRDLRYGYARGNEPVRYVARIRNYYDMLNNEFPEVFE